MRSPLGEREGQTLELKSAGALRRPESIAREVASMLNARKGKGRVWVGIAEHDGVATAEEGVPGADRARESLLNALLDRIDPEPRSELSVRKVSGESGKELLLVEVDPQAGEWRGPFALKKEGLIFLTRVDHRVRPMNREEILGAGGTAPAPDEALANLRARRDAVLQRKESRLWTAVQPSPAERVDFQPPELRHALCALLSDPARAGNRRSGWTYGTGREEPRVNARSKPVKRLEVQGYLGFELSVAADGCVEFSVPLLRVEYHVERGSKEIHPLALLEHVVSTVRLAKGVLFEALESSCDRILADVLLTGTEGWTIPQHAPGTYGHEHRDFWKPRALEDVILASPLAFDGNELRQNPDRVGFRVVREVYEHFGLFEEHVAPQYDRATERLVISD